MNLLRHSPDPSPRAYRCFPFGSYFKSSRNKNIPSSKGALIRNMLHAHYLPSSVIASNTFSLQAQSSRDTNLRWESSWIYTPKYNVDFQASLATMVSLKSNQINALRKRELKSFINPSPTKFTSGLSSSPSASIGSTGPSLDLLSHLGWIEETSRAARCKIQEVERILQHVLDLCNLGNPSNQGVRPPNRCSFESQMGLLKKDEDKQGSPIYDSGIFRLEEVEKGPEGYVVKIFNLLDDAIGNCESLLTKLEAQFQALLEEREGHSMASMLQLNTTKEEGEIKANNIQSQLEGELDIHSSTKALSNPPVYCMNELLNGNDPTAMVEDEFVSGILYGGSQDQNTYDGNRPELVPITNYYTDPGFMDPEAEVDSAICKEDPMLMPPLKLSQENST